MRFAELFAAHAEKIADEFAQAKRRVAIMAARRATENGIDPLEAANAARVLLDELGHVSQIAHVVDEIAGPLNRTAFAAWLRKREAERVERVRLRLTRTSPA